MRELSIDGSLFYPPITYGPVGKNYKKPKLSFDTMPAPCYSGSMETKTVPVLVPLDLHRRLSDIANTDLRSVRSEALVLLEEAIQQREREAEIRAGGTQWVGVDNEVEARR